MEISQRKRRRAKSVSFASSSFQPLKCFDKVQMEGDKRIRKEKEKKTGERISLKRNKTPLSETDTFPIIKSKEKRDSFDLAIKVLIIQ